MIAIKQKAVFLDRDGVLNEAMIKQGKPYPPQSLAELTIADDVLPALTLLKSCNYLLISATNQPDVARGTTSRAFVETIHQVLRARLPLDDIVVCYHDDADGCDCRKPLPGLLLQAAAHYHIDLQQSFMIGDRWKDIAAGQSAACQTIWLNRHYQEKAPNPPPDFTASSLIQAAHWIKERQSIL